MIANVQAGKALNNPTVPVSFPIGDSKAEKSARLTAALITLQNLNGSGKGCPVVSTTFPLQQKAIDAGTDVSNLSITSQAAPAPAPSEPANANGYNSGGIDAATIRSLAPEMGFQSGLNPTGSGDCDGAVNGADGKPIKIPCGCPPPQDVYLDVCHLFLLGRCRVLIHFTFLLLSEGAREKRSGGGRGEQPFGEGSVPNRQLESKPEHPDHCGVDYFTKLGRAWERVSRCKYDAVGQAKSFRRVSTNVTCDHRSDA